MQGFTLYFHFSDNEFFTNSILVKKYLLDMELNKADPYEFDGPTVAKAIGFVGPVVVLNAWLQ